jgi:hypothetical protein
MHSTSSQYSAISAFLAIGALLMMTIPAYAGDVGDKDTEQAVKADSKNGAVVNVYGDGTLMIQAPPHHGKAATVATTELLDYLVPIPAKARSLTVRQSGGTIFIEAAKPATTETQPKMADLQPAAASPSSQAAHQPALTSPRVSVSRVTRSKEIIVMNAALEE